MSIEGVNPAANDPTQGLPELPDAVKDGLSNIADNLFNLLGSLYVNQNDTESLGQSTQFKVATAEIDELSNLYPSNPTVTYVKSLLSEEAPQVGGFHSVSSGLFKLMNTIQTAVGTPFSLQNMYSQTTTDFENLKNSISSSKSEVSNDIQSFAHSLSTLLVFNMYSAATQDPMVTTSNNTGFKEVVDATNTVINELGSFGDDLDSMSQDQINSTFSQISDHVNHGPYGNPLFPDLALGPWLN